MQEADGAGGAGAGGSAAPYRNRLRRRAARELEAGRSSGQLPAEAAEAAETRSATSAVTSRRCAGGEGADCPPSEPASAPSDAARAGAAPDPHDSDASPATNAHGRYEQLNCVRSCTKLATFKEEARSEVPTLNR